MRVHWLKAHLRVTFLLDFCLKKWFETIEINYSAFVDAYGDFLKKIWH